MHKTTLEQWALLEKVVELGSFAKAAEETHRSQSSVSYNLALLQERLGVTLLTPSGRRAGWRHGFRRKRRPAAAV